MGQTNLQKIQSSVIDLHEKGEVELSQAQLFVKDYISSGEKIKDINYFLEQCSIDLFMKYYINYIYPNTTQHKQSAKSMHKSAQQKSEVLLIEQILEANSAQISEKINNNLNELKEKFISQNTQVVFIRQKIKDMLINLFEFESYRYFYYNKTCVKETNSKILYFYDIPTTHRMHGYLASRQNSCFSSAELQELVKDMYPSQQHLCFELYEDNFCHIVLIEISREKWKYSHHLNKERTYQYFKQIASLFFQYFPKIYEPEQKNTEFQIRAIYTILTLNLLEHYIMLKSISTQKSLSQLVTNEKLQLQSIIKQPKIATQKILNKLRNWKYFMNTTLKTAFFHYNKAMELQFFYTNDFNKTNLKFIASESNNFLHFIKCIISQDKKKIKKVYKLLQQKNNNKRIILGKGTYVSLYKNNQTFQIQGLSLIIQLSQNTKIDYGLRSGHKNQTKECTLEKDKPIIKRSKNSQPEAHYLGWFKDYLEDEQQTHLENCSSKRKNHIKLPKLNKSISTVKYKPAYSLYELKEQISIDDESLNVLELNSGKLQVLAIKIFSRLSYFCELPHTNDEFPNFLRQIHSAYEIHNNKFHNFSHALNVMHTCYLFCKANKNNEILTPFNKFTIIFSGLCHDVAHTGFTNLFQIARQSEIAILYNNKSPLQNFHASKTFEILKHPENNFLSSINKGEYRKFRQLTISNILYTDVKQHFSLMKRFENEKKDINSENVALLGGMIVHASDFGGSVKKFELCKTWSLLVNQQFSKQYEEQQKLKLPQTPFMKDLNIMHVLAKNEMGFLKVIVQPLYKEISSFYDDPVLNKLLTNVEDNIERWQNIMMELTN